MGVVSPIRDKEVLERMKEVLREKNTRDYLLFRIGINFGLSVQELIELRIEHVLDKAELILREYRIQICSSLQNDIRRYVGNGKKGYLFSDSNKRDEPISRFRLYGILKHVAREANFDEPVGALSLRKTFAYWAYTDQTICLPMLSKFLNHHTTYQTLNYIGLKREKKSKEIILSSLDL